MNEQDVEIIVTFKKNANIKKMLLESFSDTEIPNRLIDSLKKFANLDFKLKAYKKGDFEPHGDNKSILWYKLIAIEHKDIYGETWWFPAKYFRIFKDLEDPYA